MISGIDNKAQRTKNIIKLIMERIALCTVARYHVIGVKHQYAAKVANYLND